MLAASEAGQTDAASTQESGSANNDWDDANTGTWETATKYKRDWRIEFMARGRYWILRRGSGKQRQSIYKGKVAALNDPIRKAEYVINSELYHARRAAAAKRNQPRDGIGDDNQRPILHA